MRKIMHSRELPALILIGISTFGLIASSHAAAVPTEDCSMSLNLSGAGITNLPAGFLNSESVTHLTLDKNEIPTISSEVFSSLPKLSYLSLANNKLNLDLDLRPFSKLPSLKTLILNGNCKSRAISSQQWQTEVPDYDYRYFHYRPTTAKPDEEENLCTLQFTANLQRLTHLFVENNNIRKLSFMSGKLPALTHLYLSHNPVTINEATTFGLRKFTPALSHLYLQHCGILELDASRLPTVTSLYLDNNRIFSICNIHCPLQGLKLKIGNKLKTLSVSHNEIANIQRDSFDYTTNLLTLDLSHNKILKIPEGTFDKLQQLQSLSLEYNNCTELSATHMFRGLISLQNLSLGGNDMSRISCELFENLLVLKKLMLNFTEISSIDSKPFSKLTRLEVLSLAGNRLSSIPDDSIPSSMITLNLDNNQLSDTKNIYLSNAPYMVSLSLRENPLTTMSARWLSNVSQNLIITLGNKYNPQPIISDPIVSSGDSIHVSTSETSEISTIEQESSTPDSIQYDENQDHQYDEYHHWK